MILKILASLSGVFADGRIPGESSWITMKVAGIWPFAPEFGDSDRTLSNSISVVVDCLNVMVNCVV